MSESLRDPSSPVPSSNETELGSRVAAVPFHLNQEPVTPQGAAAGLAPSGPPAPAFEHLGELPVSYGTQSLYLVAYDPHQLFAYWDVDWSAAGGNSFALQVHREDGSVETRVELTPTESSRYIGVAQSGARYSVELAAKGRDGQWRALAVSGAVTVPPEGIAKEDEPTFATLPFHLSFQRLVDLLHTARRPHEDLTGVLARLQRGGHIAAASLLGSLGSLAPEQLRTLELLVSEAPAAFDLGRQTADGVSSAGASSSPGVSSFGRFGGSGSETLSSSGTLNSEVRLAAAAAGAEGLSSGALGSQGRWLAGGTLSSSGIRQPGPLLSAMGMGSESLSSGSAWPLGGESSQLARGGLSSGAYAAAAARGSEILGSAARPALGVSSEAWRRAGAATAGGASENLASNNQSSAFVRAVQSNLDTLGSLFSAVNSQLSGGLGGSSSGPSSPSSW